MTPSDTIRRRAEKLAAHVHRNTGPESTHARAHLRALITRYPELSALLDDPTALDFIQAEVEVTSRAQLSVLAHLASLHDCELNVYDAHPEESRLPLGRFYVEGKTLSVHRLMEQYVPHAEVLGVVDLLLGQVYTARVLPPLPDTKQGADPMQPDDPMFAPDPAYLERQVQLADRLRQVASVLDLEPVEQALEEVSDAVSPHASERAHPGHLRIGGCRPWDAPDLTFDEFCDLYWTTFPSGTMPDWQLRNKYDNGFRLHPITKSWREIPWPDRDGLDR